MPLHWPVLCLTLFLKIFAKPLCVRTLVLYFCIESIKTIKLKIVLNQIFFAFIQICSEHPLSAAQAVGSHKHSLVSPQHMKTEQPRRAIHGHLASCIKSGGGEINICLIEKKNMDREGSFILKLLIGCFNSREWNILFLFFS